MSIFSILVPLWFIIISLVFFYFCKVLFSGFVEFRGNFVDGRNNLKYRDVAPLNNIVDGAKSNIKVLNGNPATVGVEFCLKEV